MVHRWSPRVTVAAIIEHAGRYLLIEEHTPEGLRINNPAGHLEPGESPHQGVVREALEETARHFVPEALVGVYLSRFQRPGKPGPGGRGIEDVTYLRFAFCGSVSEAIPDRPLDRGIVRAMWMTPDEAYACRARHRSALVWQCIDDHRRGVRYPLALLTTHATVFAPEIKR